MLCNNIYKFIECLENEGVTIKKGKKFEYDGISYPIKPIINIESEKLLSVLRDILFEKRQDIKVVSGVINTIIWYTECIYIVHIRCRYDFCGFQYNLNVVLDNLNCVSKDGGSRFKEPNSLISCLELKLKEGDLYDILLPISGNSYYVEDHISKYYEPILDNVWFTNKAAKWLNPRTGGFEPLICLILNSGDEILLRRKKIRDVIRISENKYKITDYLGRHDLVELVNIDGRLKIKEDE